MSHTKSKKSVERIDADPGRPRLVRLDDLLDECRAANEKRTKAKESGQLLGPITGLRKLGEYLAEALSPGLHILSGGGAAGKTALVLQIATSCGLPALYIICEMSPIQLFYRVTGIVEVTLKITKNQHGPAFGL